jgi:hypothetical protein
MNAASNQICADRIEVALFKAARLLECDPTFAPIFEALESDLAAAREREAGLTAAQLRARDLLKTKSPQAASQRGRAPRLPHISRGPADAQQHRA